MILEVRKYPDEILKRRAKKVDEITPEIKELIFNMAETLRQTQGSGLAANQVGVSRRVIIVGFQEGPKAFLNPEIVKKSKEKNLEEEGCLSLPGLYLKIKRAQKIDIVALDSEGKQVKLSLSGMTARIFQHEIDHLNGILLINKIPFWKKWKLLKR